MNNNAYALKSNRVIVDDEYRSATVLIRNGKIVEVLNANTQLPADIAVEDLGDKVLMPGLVDSHVHINEPGRTEWEGFNTATQAAAAGGITTVVDMPLNCTPVTTTAAALQEKLDSLDGKLWIDCGFWGGIVPENATPETLHDLEELLQAGVLGCKSFTLFSGIHDFQMVTPAHIREAIPLMAKYDLPYLIHAELEEETTVAGKIGDKYQSFLAARPKSWENNAINMMINLAQEAHEDGVDAKIHIVHLSSAEAIPAIAAAQKEGIRISAETCPHYLTLWAEAIPDGKTLFKCCPPIREDANRQQLWQGLADGTIDFVVSDHSPCTPVLKHIDTGDIEKAWGGISSLQFGLSIIWTEARERGYSLPQVAEWMATRPAVFAGLAGKKGKIAAGYDADLVVFDPDSGYNIRAELIKYRHKVTPYEGRKVVGEVLRTYVRGQQVYADGELPGQPVGKPILAPKQPQ